MGGKEINVERGLRRHLVVRWGEAVRTIPFIVIVYLLLAYGAYSAFTSQIPSANDFYPRWRGARALIVEGRDPYSADVTLQIQKDMYGRLAREDEDQVAFAYPLYVSLFVLPFALLPYPLAQAFWLSTLILTALAALIVMVRTLHWNPSPAGLVGLALWSVLFYPTARSILLGQFSVIVLALLALALWAIHRGNLFLAGCLLAFSTVKPQMVFLIVPFLLFSTWRRGQRRTLAGFLCTMAVLLIVTSALLPTWIPSFVSALASYQSYTSIYREGRSPLGVLISYLLPSSLAWPATVLLSFATLVYVSYAWIKSFRQQGDASLALFITIIATLLLPAQTGTTNQVLLLLPILYWLAEPSIARTAKAALSSLLLVAPWLLFLLTFAQRNGEHAIMSIPLPMMAIALLWWTDRRRAHRQEHSPGGPLAPGLEDQGSRAPGDSQHEEYSRT
ncbi:MAG TPA: glycosyltransferase family 87 protein [Anaerolineae bacterium]|nr:glycosyltransferase family 87 protein [Anaerolineae bacterium]